MHAEQRRRAVVQVAVGPAHGDVRAQREFGPACFQPLVAPEGKRAVVAASRLLRTQRRKSNGLDVGRELGQAMSSSTRVHPPITGTASGTSRRARGVVGSSAMRSSWPCPVPSRVRGQHAQPAGSGGAGGCTAPRMARIGTGGARALAIASRLGCRPGWRAARDRLEGARLRAAGSAPAMRCAGLAGRLVAWAVVEDAT